MASAAMISRLSPVTTNLSGVGRGGVAEFDQFDIAMAVGCIKDRVSQLLVLAIYAGQWGEQDEREVVRLLVLRVTALWAAEEKWDVKRRSKQETRLRRQQYGGPITRMVRCAASEVVNPGHCRTCKGIGRVYRKGDDGAVAQVRCDAHGCIGGLVRLSDRVLATRCGFEASTWRKCGWSARYDRVSRLALQCLQAGVNEFNEELK